MEIGSIWEICEELTESEEMRSGKARRSVDMDDLRKRIDLTGFEVKKKERKQIKTDQVK